MVKSIHDDVLVSLRLSDDTIQPSSYKYAAVYLEGLLGENVAQGVDADAVEHILDDRLHRECQVVHTDTPLAAGGGVQKGRLKIKQARQDSNTQQQYGKVR